MSAAARLVAVAPVLVCIGATAVYSVNVPFWDDWDIVPIALSAISGVLDLQALWGFANEHRPVLPRVVTVVLAAVSGYDVRSLLVLSRVLETTALVAVGALLFRRTGLSPTRARALLVGVALLMFSATRYETWIWPVSSVQWSVHALAAVGTAALLGRERPALPHVLAAGLLVVADTLGMSTGLALWLGGLLAVASADRVGRWRNCAAWTAFGAVVVGILWEPLVAASPSAPEPVGAILLFLATLGSPLAYRAGVVLPVLLGVLALVGFLVGAWRAQDRRFTVLGGQALVTVLMISVGRTGSTAPDTIPARYTWDPALLWTATIVLLGSRWPAGRTAQWVSTGATGLLLAAYGAAYAAGWNSLQELSRKFSAGRDAVLVYEQACDDHLAALHRSPAHVRRFARELEEGHLGPFADPPAGVPPGGCPDRSSPATLEARAPGYAGHVEYAGCDVVAGWASDLTRKFRVLEVELWVDGAPVARSLADAPREFRLHGYRIEVPQSLRDGNPHAVAVRLAGIDADLPPLPGVALTISCEEP